MHHSPIRYISKKEKYLRSSARGTSREQTLEVAHSPKMSIKLECKGSSFGALRCFAAKITGFRKQKLHDYARLSSYFSSLFFNLSCWCCKPIRINNNFKAQIP